MTEEIKYCECGCGKEIKPTSRFAQGHNMKGKAPFKGKKHRLESKNLISKSFKNKRGIR